MRDGMRMRLWIASFSVNQVFYDHFLLINVKSRILSVPIFCSNGLISDVGIGAWGKE